MSFDGSVPCPIAANLMKPAGRATLAISSSSMSPTKPAAAAATGAASGAAAGAAVGVAASAGVVASGGGVVVAGTAASASGAADSVAGAAGAVTEADVSPPIVAIVFRAGSAAASVE
jgi:hypothetical protein